jgi:hypothetical protein
MRLLNSTIFWDITPCSPLRVNWRFRNTHRLHLQGRRISQAKNQHKSRWQASMLLSCSAYSSTLKMEAICSSETSVHFQQTTRRYIPEDSTLHNHCCENLKSYKWDFCWQVESCYSGASQRILIHHPHSPSVSPILHLTLQLLWLDYMLCSVRWGVPDGMLRKWSGGNRPPLPPATLLWSAQLQLWFSWIRLFGCYCIKQWQLFEKCQNSRLKKLMFKMKPKYFFSIQSKKTWDSHMHSQQSYQPWWWRQDKSPKHWVLTQLWGC